MIISFTEKWRIFIRKCEDVEDRSNNRIMSAKTQKNQNIQVFVRARWVESKSLGIFQNGTRNLSKKILKVWGPRKAVLSWSPFAVLSAPRGDMITVYQVLHRGMHVTAEHFLTMQDSERARGHQWKLRKPRATTFTRRHAHIQCSGHRWLELSARNSSFCWVTQLIQGTAGPTLGQRNVQNPLFLKECRIGLVRFGTSPSTSKGN